LPDLDEIKLSGGPQPASLCEELTNRKGEKIKV